MKKMYVTTLLGATLLLSSFTVAKNESSEIVNIALNKAVSQKIISEQERQQLIDSEILDVAYNTFIQTKGDTKATVDAIADQLVKKEYFSSRRQAKSFVKKSLEQIRKNGSWAQKVYRYLGL